MAESEFDINFLVQEAKIRWLRPAEVHFILQNHEKYDITQKLLQKPTSGSLFLFDRRVLRFFRNDGHNWRKKKNGIAVSEAHERLKVGRVEALNCYYVHGEDNPNFQRRSYWMLDLAYKDIVLVHYRDITEGKPNSGDRAQFSPIFTKSGPSSSCNGTQNLLSAEFSNSHELHKNLSSLGSVEDSSKVVTTDISSDTPGESSGSAKLEEKQVLRRLEEQLSLNKDNQDLQIQQFTLDEGNHFQWLREQLSLDKDDFIQVEPIYNKDGSAYDPEFREYEKEISEHDQLAAIYHTPETSARDRCYDKYAETGNHFKYGAVESQSWEEKLDTFDDSLDLNIQGNLSSSSDGVWLEPQQDYPLLNYDGSSIDQCSVFLPQELNNATIPTYSSPVENPVIRSDYFTLLSVQGQTEMPLESNLGIAVAQRQKFTIKEISPEWGYASEATKVIIVGSFLCDPTESTWRCMFGDTEVPIQIIQEGVLHCTAPPHHPKRVTLCITSGNRESCSEIREFEYRDSTITGSQCKLDHSETSKSPEELLLLVRFVQILLCDPPSQNADSTDSQIHQFRKSESDDDSWNNVMETLLFGGGASSGTVEWLLQELLKDKLHYWLSSKSQGKHSETGCSLSRKEQGVIHMAAGLGFEWALSSILSHGVGIDFRDINGWTALHWAARFGREKMVAALIASGASAGAVSDPRAQDPTGKSPASIAASNGHKGLAGYLSEVALTSHLSSLKIEESEFSKDSAKVQAEMAVDNISKKSLTTADSFNVTMGAIRNTTQAAARIQAAFRLHSFRKRQRREANAASTDEYGISSDSIQALSTMSKMTFGQSRFYNTAALVIQKKYRGWKGRRAFKLLRQKVVKIQAHVRGYQARKHYKVMCWAVGILDKVVLRWRRKGVGLSGFLQEREPFDDSDDEDILKVFRRQKVDAAIDEAVSRVLSMVDNQDARRQYRRLLEKYRQVKAELGETSEAYAPSSLDVISDMERVDFQQCQ